MAAAAETAQFALREATARDVDRLLRWFPDEMSVRVWGGPTFRYPFTRHSFAEDMQWGRIASFSLVAADDEAAGFGQLYERFDRINLARLVVEPGRRGRGLGRRLVRCLLDEGRARFPCAEYSLFVYRDNATALACYEALGFRVSPYPPGAPLADECFYLTRPVFRPQPP
ncbi:MAG: GNAT family N-acetyltransferase [Woeseiaceae bacterium]|nr:GNAT family N-acetyltransferase [Woeseiaceae bacterium]